MLANLLELRKRLLHCLCWMGLCFVFCFYYANQLYLMIVHPLLIRLPTDSQLIATNITATVLTPLQLAIHMALLLAMPMVLWQIWAFIAPGLYLREKRPLRQAVVWSWGLFICGVAFGYYVALPLLFSFFIQVIPEGIRLLPDIRQTLDFILWMLTVFGLSFQVPLVCAILVRAHCITLQQLITIRPYIIVLAFVLGMILTPPDVLSQVILAVPLCLLYELGIILARILIMREKSLVV